MSYAVWVKIRGEKPATNAVRYATFEEADRAGYELLSRWHAPESFEVRESEDEVNYRLVDGHPQSLAYLKDTGQL